MPQLSIFSILCSSLLASVVSAADVYANFVDKSSGTTITPAFDVSNTGCFNVDVKGQDAGVFFTQSGTSPGVQAHGPYCLYVFNQGGCPTVPNQLVYGYTFQDVPVNNQYMYYPSVCTATGQRSFQWSPNACTAQGTLGGAFLPGPLNSRDETEVSAVNASMTAMLIDYSIQAEQDD